jgi:hypothetical protein
VSRALGQHAADAIGVALFVEGEQRGEMGAGPGIDEIDGGEIPSSDAEP